MLSMIPRLLRRTLSLLFPLALLTSAWAAQAVPRYEIDTVFQPAEGTLKATVSVHYPAAPVGTKYALMLARTFTVVSVTGRNATVAVTDADLPIPNLRLISLETTSPDESSVTFTYEGRLGSWTEQALNSVSPDLIEVNLDSFWFPYPAPLASSFTVTGTVRGLPTAAAVVSSHAFTRTPDGIRLEADVPAMDLAIIASPDFRTVTEGRLQFRAQDLESATALFYREHGERALRFLEQRVGPSSRDSLAITVVRRANGSGYARPGYVVVTEGAALDRPAAVAKFIAHELAHGWFSRADPQSEDYWLTESPAEYLGLVYAESVFGPEALEILLTPKRTRAAEAGSLLGRGRVSDSELYNKGPLLLFALEAEIGRPAVMRVLAALAADAPHTTRRFVELLAAEAGAATASAFELKLH